MQVNIFNNEAHLEHERPVGPRLRLAAGRRAAVAMQQRGQLLACGRNTNDGDCELQQCGCISSPWRVVNVWLPAAVKLHDATTNDGVDHPTFCAATIMHRKTACCCDHTYSLQQTSARTGVGAVGRRVVAEHRRTVVGAVVLWEVQPALGAVRAGAAQADADDVAVAVLQPVRPLGLAEPPAGAVCSGRWFQRFS